ncbi:MAG: hypothetical protein GY928_31925 [Colwellia sp.]|nr:hypothetical protein [Colwellia sp.]
MSEKSSRTNRLPEGFSEFVELQLQHNENTNNQMKGLVEKFTILTETMAKFVTEMTLSEERHNSHRERMERIEENQRQQGKLITSNNRNLVDKVDNVSRQVLALEKDNGHNNGRWDLVIKAVTGIGATVAGAALIYAFVSKGG